MKGVKYWKCTPLTPEKINLFYVLGTPVSSKTTITDVSQGEPSQSPTCEMNTSNEASQSQNIGCGLRYLVSKVKEHYDDTNRRHNKIRTRLIGRQATALAQYAYRLVDALQFPNETPLHSLKRLALGRIIYYLRNACAVFNKLFFTPADLVDLEDNCKLFFNSMCLFYPTFVNVTTWTIAYAIPYHAIKLYDTYRVGYGIISLQAKEANHAAIKDLVLTNRSTSTGSKGKWWQLIRANYVRSFYRLENQPMPSTYKSHFQSRVSSHCDQPGFCNCGRKLEDNVFCYNCLSSREIVKCAQNHKFSDELIIVLKPVSCDVCG